MDAHQFDEIRPYTDEEVGPAMRRVADSPQLEGVFAYLYPGQPTDSLRDMFRGFKTSWDFQTKVMLHAMRKIALDTTSGLTTSGFDLVDAQNGSLIISNHRDILLDSAFLQMLMYENGYPTTEISFGDNLMTSDFLVDIGKSNRMFKVLRNAHPREFYKNSSLLSKYIRLTLTENHHSIWIAQRNGRTKDGLDATEQGVLKMFDMSGEGDFISNFVALRILPMSVSYEYEPCDVLKTNELYISRRKKYTKMPGEDLNSILTGIMQQKGGVHYALAPILTEKEIAVAAASGDKNERFKALAHILDERIVRNYKLWKTNYIAYDLLNKTASFAEHYSPKDQEAFLSYMHYKLSPLEGDKDELEDIFLNIYANPIVNKQRFNCL